MPYIQTDPSPNVAVIQTYIAALEKWDLESIMGVFDDNLEHHILPLSLARPVSDKKAYREWFVTVMPLFQNFELKVHELIETGDKIVAHASSVGISALNTPYTNEYIVIFHMCASSTGDGTRKIKLVKEFVDSGYSKDWFAAEREKVAAVKKQSA